MKKTLLLALVLALAVGPASAATLALLHADTGFAPGAQTKLLATGRFSAVDLFPVNSGLPSLATLSGYDAVLAWTNNVPTDPLSFGNLLADYYDLGSKRLTVATYSMSNPWAITGRVTTGDYVGLTNLGVNGNVSGNLVATGPDPLFDGIDLGSITYFHNSNFSHPGLASGATLLATDGGGIYMIARSANGVYWFNLFPGFISGNNDELYELFANSFTATNQIPEPSTFALMGIGLGLLALMRRK
jgi:hypothetical protein